MNSQKQRKIGGRGRNVEVDENMVPDVEALEELRAIHSCFTVDM